MNSTGNLIRVILIVFFLASPAVGIKILSMYSSDPYLQPLALTKQGVDAAEKDNGAGGHARIAIHVNWGRQVTGSLTREQLQHTLAATLRQQTELLYIEFHEAPGSKVDVTFVVGPNSYGPLPPARMIDGLNSALIALRMTNRLKG